VWVSLSPRQGLKEKINMCLFTLAFVDLVYLTIIFVLYAERMVMPFPGSHGERLGPVYRYMVNNSIVGERSIRFVQITISTILCSIQQNHHHCVRGRDLA
jgi:hypothetical protein